MALPLVLAGCGSESNTADLHSPGEHMEEHSSEYTDGHTDHDGIGMPEVDGHHHAGGETMEKPEDARLVTVTASNYEFSPAKISAKPGEKLYIKLVNKSNAAHMWQLRDMAETHIHTPVGETAARVVTAPEQPGNYEIFCGTAGHEERGMVGTLAVSE